MNPGVVLLGVGAVVAAVAGVVVGHYFLFVLADVAALLAGAL